MIKVNNIELIEDLYDGVTINNKTILKGLDSFENNLLALLENLRGKKLLWIKLDIKDSSLIPILTQLGFVFYSCNQKDITLVKKLIKSAIIPVAKNHTIGVGAVVINENKLLVIKDCIRDVYRLPGGYIDNEESISVAAKREVLEETGVKIDIESIISLAHSYPSAFDESNFYIVAVAKALSFGINISDTDEITEAKWIDIEEFFNTENIIEYNKEVVKIALEKKGLKIVDKRYFNSSRVQEFFTI